MSSDTLTCMLQMPAMRAAVAVMPSCTLAISATGTAFANIALHSMAFRESTASLHWAVILSCGLQQRHAVQSQGAYHMLYNPTYNICPTNAPVRMLSLDRCTQDSCSLFCYPVQHLHGSN